MRYIVGLVVVPLTAVLFVACSEDDANTSNPPPNNPPPVVSCQATFGGPDACGGDPSGTWTFATACGTAGIAADAEAGLAGLCPEADVAPETFEGGTGTLDISGGSFSGTLRAGLDFSLSIPTSCFIAGVLDSCEDIEMTFEGSLGRDLVNADVTCTEVNDACECELTANYVTMSSGSLTVTSSIATVDGTTTFYYCVEDDTMTLREFNSGGLVGPTYVLTR